MADSFYGEDWGFKGALEELGAAYVLALKPSHAWWHKEGEIGSPFEAAVAAGQRLANIGRESDAPESG